MVRGSKLEAGEGGGPVEGAHEEEAVGDGGGAELHGAAQPAQLRLVVRNDEFVRLPVAD